MVSPSINRFQTASIGGAELEYEVRGDGEAVLFIHGGIVGDAFAPLMAQASLTADYRLINYHRRGYLGSAHLQQPVTIRQHAEDARALLDLLDVEQAHIVGHSLGGLIALQLAHAEPHRVHSLALLEPDIPTRAYARAFVEAVDPIVKLYRDGDTAAAIDAICQAVAGPRYRDAMTPLLARDWFEWAVADASTLFEIEIPAMLDFELSPDQLAAITQPVLYVVGAESAAVDPSVEEVRDFFRECLPQIELFVLPGATHGLQMMNPSGMAGGLARFFKRHPVRAGHRP